MRPPAVLFVDQSGELGGAELSLLDIVSRRQGRSEVRLFGDGAFAVRLRDAGVPVRVLGLGGVDGVRRKSGLGALLAAPALVVAVIRDRYSGDRMASLMSTIFIVFLGVPVIAPAIANAVAQLSGKRLRHLPMTPDRVKQTLG